MSRLYNCMLPPPQLLCKAGKGTEAQRAKLLANVVCFFVCLFFCLNLWGKIEPFGSLRCKCAWCGSGAIRNEVYIHPALANTVGGPGLIVASSNYLVHLSWIYSELSCCVIDFPREHKAHSSTLLF